MLKRILYIGVVLFICFSCEDVYHPNLDQVENQVVIEALVTNDASKNFVKISKTKGFYDTGGTVMVSGGRVQLMDEDGNVYAGFERSPGNFQINHGAVPGKKYQLRVEAEGDTYESDFEEMPPVPTYDSLYAVSEEVTDYHYSSYGEPIANTLNKLHAYIDLPVTDSLSRYRFSLNKTLLYVIPPPPMSFSATYAWIKIPETGNFNIKAPSRYGAEGTLKKHSLLYLSKNLGDYIAQELIDYAYAYMEGWLVNMDEYGLSETTYNFYKSMNDQLDANGKLFDAVYAQLESNISCISNPNKNVFGFFELSSYRATRFFVYSTMASDYVYFHVVKNNEPIPESDEIQSITPPDFWENRYGN